MMSYTTARRHTRLVLENPGNIVREGSLQLNEVDSAISTLRRKRRKHPSLIKTRDGVEAIVPGLSTWTVEDLLEAGAWDDELAEIADFEEVYPDDSDRDD